MKISARHFYVMVLFLAGLTSVRQCWGQSGGVSTPFGFVQETLTPSADGTNRAFSVISFPMHQTPLYVGLVSTATNNTITFSGAIPSGLTASPYMVHVESSSNAVATGQTFFITASTSNGVTVASSAVPVQSLLTTNDRVAIRAAETLGSIFGSTNSTVLLQGGQTAAAADMVYVWNGDGYDSYYYIPSWGWVEDGDPNFTVQNNLAFYPDEGVMVGRISTNALPVSYATSVGTVATNAQKALVNAPGTTFISNPLPIPVTLSQFGFTNSPSWMEGRSSGGSDLVYLYQGADWQAYYYLSGYGWVEDGDPTFTLQTNTLIPAASAMLVLRHETVSASNAYIPIPLEYTPPD